MQIQFDRLNDVVRATERLPLGGFDMARVVTVTYPECGSAGCMIGNYNAMTGRDRHTFGYAKGTIPFVANGRICDWEHFGISEAEYQWLFSECAIIRSDKDPWKRWLSPVRKLATVTSEEAITRLRKYLAYKRRKHELIHDPKYGVKDYARHAEGNHNVVMLAKQEVSEGSLATAN